MTAGANVFSGIIWRSLLDKRQNRSAVDVEESKMFKMFCIMRQRSGKYLASNGVHIPVYAFLSSHFYMQLYYGTTHSIIRNFNDTFLSCYLRQMATRHIQHNSKLH